MLARCLALLVTGFAIPAAAGEVSIGGTGAETEACLAEAVYFEARGTNDITRAAVAHVIVNRSKDPEFPDSICSVVRDGCQFSYQCDGRSETLDDPQDRDEAYETA